MSKKPTIIETAQLGKLSYTKLNKLVKQHGSQAELAREIGVPSSTVRGWKHTLVKARSNA